VAILEYRVFIVYLCVFYVLFIVLSTVKYICALDCVYSFIYYMCMLIERIEDKLGGYSVYRASWRGLTALGANHIQAISNLLGRINGLRYDIYVSNIL